MMNADEQIIWLKKAAPAKPAFGMPCNGCGVCCASTPCPVALVFLRQRQGSCRALEWDADKVSYRCGMVVHPEHYIHFVPVFAHKWLRRWIYRWIAAGTACDSVLGE